MIEVFKWIGDANKDPWFAPSVAAAGIAALAVVLIVKLALARLNARIISGRQKRMKDTIAQIENAWATEKDLESPEFNLLPPTKKGFRLWPSKSIRS